MTWGRIYLQFLVILEGCILQIYCRIGIKIVGILVLCFRRVFLVIFFGLLKKYFRFYCQQKLFWINSLMITLLMMIPFVNFYTVGYVIEILKRSWLEPDPEVFPPIKPILPIFLNSLIVMGISTVWALPLSLLAVVSLVFTGQDLVGEGPILSFAVFVVGLLLLFFLPAIIVRYEKTKSWKVFFNVSALFSVILPVFNMYVALFFMMCASIFVVVFIGQILSFFTLFLQLLFVRFGSITVFCFFYFLLGKVLRGNFSSFLEDRQIETIFSDRSKPTTPEEDDDKEDFSDSPFNKTSETLQNPIDVPASEDADPRK